MTFPSDSTKPHAPHRYGFGDPRLGVWLPAGWGPRFIDLAVEPDRLSLLDCCSPGTRQALLYIRALRRSRRTHRRRLAMFETRERAAASLRTLAEAARKLRCSIKTLREHVALGALKYVALGHGKKRQHRMFTDADLDEFIANQTRKDSPCPSDATRGRRSGNTASKSEIVSFSEVQRRRRSAKPKR
jgi:hypothetical protein